MGRDDWLEGTVCLQRWVVIALIERRRRQVSAESGWKNEMPASLLMNCPDDLVNCLLASHQSYRNVMTKKLQTRGR